MMKDSLQSIQKSANLFFSGTFLSRLSGMLRDMSMAYAFGTQPAVASFMVAFRFAHLLRRLFGEGALQSAFIPEFENLRQINQERAFVFFCDLTRSLIVFLVLICGLICGALKLWLYFGALSESSKQILDLTILMMPSLIFICLYGLNSAFLQCQKSYFIPSVAPIIFNGIWIASALYLSQMSIDSAMSWLSVVVILACMGQWAFTLPSSRFFLKNFLSFKFSLSLSKDVRALLKPLSLGMIGVGASQINNAVDSVFALFADLEGPALLWYAIRIQQLPLALFGIAAAGAVLPPLSRAIQSQNLENYRFFLQTALQRTLMFMVPISVFLILSSENIVYLLYARGDFGLSSVKGTSDCLIAYTLGLLPSALILVMAPAYYSQRRYFLPTLASCLNIGMNVVFNSLFIFVFGWGAVSVAVATSISAWMNVFLLCYKTWKEKLINDFDDLFKNFLFVSSSAFLAFCSVKYLAVFVEMPLESTFKASFFSFLFQIIVFSGVFFSGVFLLRKILIKKTIANLL